MDESSEDAIVFSLRDAPKICQVILVHNSSDFHVIWFLLHSSVELYLLNLKWIPLAQ